MGNNQNNTVIEYWTKTGIKVSYFFWDLKGKNRYSESPSDIEGTFALLNTVFAMFQKCLQEIDISSYQLSIIREFTPKYKYRFVILHNRKVAQSMRERQLQKFSRESYCLQVVEEVKTVESQKKLEKLENLIKSVELNESSIKTSLINVDRFVSEAYVENKFRCAQNEFIELKGIERFLELLDSATRLNSQGSKTSFASQIQLLKFFRYFSLKYNKEFYSYLSHIRSYPSAILRTYHPINTQIIAYSLHLLSEYSWKGEGQNTLIQILQKNRISQNIDSFLSPFVESIIESDSIVSVYHNIKFINDLMASALTKSDKQILQQNLFKVKYSLVLENVKIKLETMQYSFEKTTFISVYQKIFKYSVEKQNTKSQKPKIDAILEENFRHSTALNNRNSLEVMHEQAIANMIKIESQQNIDFNQNIEDDTELTTYLTQNDRSQFNKVIFDTLTEMQKFYKLQFYLQTSEDETLDVQLHKAKQLIDSRIIEHNLETYFSKIKQQCLQNKCTQILNNCLKKIQFYQIEQWKDLENFVYEEPGQRKKVLDELQELKHIVEDKQSKIKILMKENNDLKAKNQELKENLQKNQKENSLSEPALILVPPPNLQSSLKLSESTNLSQNGSLNSSSIPSPFPFSLPTIPLPTLPLLPEISLLGNLNKEKKKEKRKPPKTLKTCNYTTIPYEKIKNTIFDEIDDTKVEIDEEQLVKLFTKNSLQQKSPLKRSETVEIRITLSPSVRQTIKLLKSDRQKNIEIILVKLKIPKREIKKVLLECSGKFASQHALEVIEKILPSEEQEQILNAFDGNDEDLGVSERFLKDLISVPQYQSRIKALVFSHTKEEIYFQIESKIKQLQLAFVSLRTNSRLKCIIQNCLAIGNYLNGQNVKGGAWGFKLETIERLEEVKAGDNDMNGALYLIKQVLKHYSYPLFERSQLEMYQFVSKMPISQVKHELDQLHKYTLAIQKALDSKDPENQSDKIAEFCGSFKNEANDKFTQLKHKYQQLKDQYLKCASYFCEDGNTLTNDEFGKKMYQCILFVSNTEKIWKVISEKNSKLQKHRAKANKVEFNEFINPEKMRQSAIDFRISSLNDNENENLSKTISSMIYQSSKNRNSQLPTEIANQSRRSSFLFEIHKPSKPLQELNQEERQQQIHTIQQESLNKAMEDVFRRRTIRFQNINLRFSKVNGVQKDGQPQLIVNELSKVQDISFLKEVSH